ncbi:RsmB/NOP family class I SAM-dependent RNA methyltransferase [Pelagicoccus sp. SDUM812005]|uniref:RsmB/NOP family class I SAM-dependent RNA methyltransferase n=1 Tax=Pelagicoccus sp. SDUM812005 TaxID=3041257 RepID=UPI00280DAA81|nr:RsmB/NOP family class I SAM-dependent RNA methyltransferase [Pelagicoccus sp. SDUM812005]MDQ8183203.1 RsmB/NOP family class I SAM-dependent RNA methyltransferase [Pelagicoccus sp. SDUM812005]
MSHLLEQMPTHWDAGTRRTCQSLLFGTVRHIRLLEKALDEFLRRRPKPAVWASLLVASRELMENPDRSAKIVHHAVERIGKRFSKVEKGLANAVLRKVAQRLPELQDVVSSDAKDLAWRYSHPKWLVKRWLKQFGLEETIAFLKWNQEEAGLFARWQREPEELEALSPLGDGSPFFRVIPGSWQWIASYIEEGRLYVQNPAAGLAPQLLLDAVGSGRVLDLCAAPGGKGLFMESVAGEGIEEIVSVDLEGPRLERMKGNFERYRAKRLRALGADLFELDAASTGLFDGVLLDAPCSNSGVLQHKVDARWRQSPQGLEELLALQARLLAAASAFVKEGGALVYSTCSVDAEENEGIVSAFLQTEKGKPFALVESKLSLPWRDARDGAGVFLMRRAGP